MKPYTRQAACDRCNARLTVTATRGTTDRVVTAFTVPCPSCHHRIALEASCDLVEETIQVVVFERPA